MDGKRRVGGKKRGWGMGETNSLLQKRLRSRWLRNPNITQILPRLQRLEPDVQPDDQREEGAYHREVAVEFEPAARAGHDDGGDGDEEGDED